MQLRNYRHIVCRNLIVLVLCIQFIDNVQSQSNFKPTERCIDAPLFCSLHELNGYTHRNLSKLNYTNSDCFISPTSDKTVWIAFSSHSDYAYISITARQCTNGIQWGINKSCNWGDELICRADQCVLEPLDDIICVNLEPCKIYYLWVNGCNGDVCEFNITATPSVTSVLEPLSKINKDFDQLLNICPGEKQRFYVNRQNTSCAINYIWKLDSKILPQHTHEIELEFNRIGNFKLCVFATVGEVYRGKFCQQTLESCIQLEVNYTSDCWPAGSTNCWYAPAFCSANEMNGLLSVNDGKSNIKTSVCNNTIQSNNIRWFSFGGAPNTFIKLIAGDCEGGLRWGITDGCYMGGDVYCSGLVCMKSNSSDSFKLNLDPCKQYYMWVDRCDTSICSFKIESSSSRFTYSDSLGPISDKYNRYFDYYEYDKGRFSVEILNKSCSNLHFIWSLDSYIYPYHDSVLNVPLEVEGIYNLCVYATSGITNASGTCFKTNKVCTKIRVITHRLPDCYPQASDDCNAAYVFCSISELNGYECLNNSNIPSMCNPPCSQGGVPHNTSWWAFTSLGGKVDISLTVGNCGLGQGLQFGVYGDCYCGEEVICKSIPCIPPYSLSTVSANLKPCKVYYLWIDGCSGDICNFTINTSGGGFPQLSPLGFINNAPSLMIQPVCQGACNYLFFINPQLSGCEANYLWQLDGDEVGGTTNEIRLDFPEQGDFVLCVTAYIGNFLNGSVCTQEGPRCTTVKVRPFADKLGKSRTICWEAANPGGYKWHSQRIYTSGTYRQQFTDANCCKFDSVVDFSIQAKPESSDVIFITCDNKPYIDKNGMSYYPCKNQYDIVLKKSTSPFQCDSTIRLTAINVNLNSNWKIKCIQGKLEISANLTIEKPCNFGESYQFVYRWYTKKDSFKNLISSNENLVVNAKNEEYCLEVDVITRLDSAINICTKTFCEPFNEDNLAPACFPLSGEINVCLDEIVSYWIDTVISQKVTKYNWLVQGGSFISNPDSQAVLVRWAMQSNDTGKICVFYETECGTSCQRCLNVTLATAVAGKDFKQKGIFAKLDAGPGSAGEWRKISGPGNVFFQNPRDPKTRIRIDEYGSYCFEWRIDHFNCILIDTVCAEFYTIKITDPDTPDKTFDHRNKSLFKKHILNDFFTPNLISNRGFTFISFTHDVPAKLNYRWINILGQNEMSGQLHIQSNQQIEIPSPVKHGFYLLLVEINGVYEVIKICVME